MKNIITFLLSSLLAIAASAQLNTDSVQNARPKSSIYNERSSRNSDHLHPKVPNIANPKGPGYDIDGTVYRSEAIINRHVTNINDLFK
jgi:hypothetical protein